VIALGALGTAAAVIGSSNAARREADAAFVAKCEATASALEQRIGSYAAVLEDAAALFAASSHVERSEWRAYVGAVRPTERFPGLYGLAYVERVAAPVLASFEAEVRENGVPDFHVHRPTDADLDNSDGPHYVIKYHEPDGVNHVALGLDLASRSVNKRVYDDAMISGESRVSEGLQLAQEPAGRLGLVVAHPVYRNSAPVASPEDREAALEGWVAAPISLASLVEPGVVYDPALLGLRISERTATGDRVIFESAADAGETAPGPGPLTRTIVSGGRVFAIAMRPASGASFRADASVVGLTLLSGVLATACAAGLVWSIVRARRRLASDRERLARENQSLRQALNEHTLFSIADRSGRIVDVNEGFCRISGYTRHELIGQDHRILNSGHHPRSFWVDMWRTIASGRPWRDEVCNRAKDGSIYWVDSTNVPHFDEDGEIDRYVSLRFDITERKAAERLNRVLMAAFERCPDPMVVADLDGLVRYANPAAREFDARLGHELDGGTSTILFTPGRAEADVQQRILEAVTRGEPFEERVRVSIDRDIPLPALETANPADERAAWLHVAASPLLSDDGDVESVLLIKRDITELVRAERDARLRTEGAETQARIGAILSQEAPLTERVEEALGVVVEMDDLDIMQSGGLYTLEPGDDRLRMFASVGELSGRSSSGNTELPLSSSLSGRAARSGELLISDRCSGTEGPDHARAVVDEHGHYIIPLMEEASCVGVLLLYTSVNPSREPARSEAMLQIGELFAAAVVRERDRAQVETAARELRELQGRFERAVGGTSDGLWDYVPFSGEVWYADQFKRLIGLEPHEFDSFEPTLESFVDLLHPDDKDPTLEAVRDHLENHAPYDVEYRLRMRHGDYRWFRTRATST
ncbi:MAG: CHASE domain-containing protein, partial [Planctomycetota bacterium]